MSNNNTVSQAPNQSPAAPVSIPSSPNAPSIVVQTTSVAPTTLNAPNTPAPDTSTPNAAPQNTPTPNDPASSRQGSVVVQTSVITASSNNNGGGNNDNNNNNNNGGSGSGPQTVLITSTSPAPAAPANTNTRASTASHTSSATSSGAAAATADATKSADSGGLPAGGRIAIAVVVPIAAVALIVLAALFWWRRRKQRKDAEELRRKEVEEYGFNPNNDPTLPAVAGASSNGDDPSEMREADGSGYRGWGTTTTATTTRKPSTTLSSGAGGIGIARSGSDSDPGGYQAQGSPTAGTNQGSDVHSGDPLVGNGRPLTSDSETIGALGAAPPANGNRQDRDMHRGPSNASSAYSGGHRSDHSADAGGAAGQHYYNDGMYYDDAVPQHGPYGDGTKFGKHLQKRQLDIPEYGASFVNYKALKKLIKQLSATPTLAPQNVSVPPIDPQLSLQANRATFFFRLERELEKVNAFYMQKEAELKLRLKTLLDKKRMMQVRHSAAPKFSASFITLEEGFQQFGTDLSKLQWDKTSKSRTKELYLSRAVEVQPCFNRDVISDLSDQATTSLLELGAWADGDKVQYDTSRPPPEHVVSGQSLGTDEDDIDSQILQAANAGNLIVLQDWVTRLKESPDAKIRFTRTFLGAIGDASQEALNVLLASGLVDLHAEDEINERNCLHEAAISGVDFVLEVGIRDGVALNRVDVYGRVPLHYACIHGHVKMVQILVEQGLHTINTKDHDNFTPLIHGIVHHQLACVEQLLSHGSRFDPDSDSDHVPLNLACQHGSIAITQLLLERKAQVLPDAEGLFPQHLVARSGRSADMLLMLEHYGADLDQQDNLYQWTPLFHAAAEGKVDCLKVLLERGVDIRILDEKGLAAMYYATWEGHLDCMRLLSSMDVGRQSPQQSRRRQQGPQANQLESTSVPSMTLEADGIPDLSLPPPIIPLRRYGHNFLDSKAFIQICFGEADSEPVLFYHDSKYPAARLTISSKTTDIIPRNLMLPIQEDNRMISFQIDNLESFTLDFDIYPTFGSKIIARSVGLPSLFSAISSSSGRCCLPLFDPRLRAIGQISFEYQVIKPFTGTPLEITHFATYWKATSQLDTHPSALITGSSLSGDYAQICVQVTRDGVPVIYPRWILNHHGIEIPISRLSYTQYLSLSSQYGQEKEVLYTLTAMTTDDMAKIHSTLATGFFTLRDVLTYLATSVHINVQVLFPTVEQEVAFDLGPSPNINSYADAILKEVFDHARRTREENPDSMRSIVFTSYNPDICTALNWKQPNYPVLLCNDLGSENSNNASTHAAHVGDDRNSFSVKEAVRTAQSNNFMGLICKSRLVDLVPALIESIKVAGLVLVVDMSEHHPARENLRVPEGVDGMVKADGVLRFNEVVDM
ncbi:MAG: hypothetical protein Q9168_006546 [Polycauliona sp. 1 TL-2023]